MPQGACIWAILNRNKPDVDVDLPLDLSEKPALAFLEPALRRLKVEQGEAIKVLEQKIGAG